MLGEEKLIPYHPTNLTGKRVLVLAPHPDDETIGCGGSLAIHANAGDPVKVIFLTNGARGDTSGKAEKKSYIKIRQEEAHKACRCLGITDLEFWVYEDRALAGSRGVLTRMIDLLEGYKPELVYSPSLLEIHPDHRAAAILVCEAIRSCDLRFEVAFYEVSQPLSVNCFVDITSVLNQKILAANAYSSQLHERPYKDIFLGLNRFRSLTLPDGVTHAEGFSLWETGVIRKIGPYAIPFQNIEHLAADPEEVGPLVSVIVRTKDRPSLLANALKSIVQQTYTNLEIVVVNDGGQDVKDIVRALAGVTPVVYVNHEKSRGRSAAANAGLDHAQGLYLIFLDDDDWFEPNHISSLVAALEKEPQARVAYTGVRGVFNTNDDKPGGELFFNQRFDPVGLLGGNYIPIHAALFHRSLLRSGCRFDENLEVYEDWDFWLQLSRFTRFIHLDQTSAVYRASHNSGVGLLIDENKVDRGREAIYEKWGKIWSGKEINALLTQTEQVPKALAEEVESSKKFLSGQAEEIRAKDGVINGQAEEIRAKDGVINGQAEEIRAKDGVINGQAEEIRAKDGVINGQAEEIRAKDGVINGQAEEIRAKKTHIHNLESELITIKHSRAWRMAKFFRHLFYIKLLGKFPLLQKGVLTISREGIPEFFAKTKRYLRKNKDVATMGLIESDYDKWIKKNQLTDEMIGEIKRDIARFQYRPKVSIIMPVYNVDQVWLEKAIDSVINQLYENWELCIVDDGSTENSLLEFLRDAMSLDTRIKIQFGKENRGISFASNQALKMASGEFVTLLDNDDELSPIALSEVVRVLNKHPDTDYIYSDEDRIEDDNGKIRRHTPFFKPDWSPYLLFNCMYTGHLSVYRKSLIEELGGFRPEYDFSQDYDLALRVTEKTDNIYHIPKILYHWRVIPGSAAAGDKDYARKSNIAALEDAVRRRQLDAQVIEYPFANRVKFNLSGCPFVSIIIPSDSENNIFNCIDLLKNNTSYPNYEVIAVCNSRLCDKINTYYQQDSLIKSCPFDGPFNFSLKCNLGTKAASGELLLFLNDDIEAAEQKDWIETLVSVLEKKGAGGVSPKLFYEDDTIQYAGMVTGVRNLVGTAFHCQPKDSGFYFNMILSEREVSLLSGACMLIPRRIFEEVGGFDAENTPVMHSDIDLCFRIRQKGYSLVYTPFASLRHIGHLSLKEVDQQNKKEKDKAALYILKKWGDYLSKDPFYTYNMKWILYQNGTIHYKLIAGRQEEPVKDTKNILFVTHDLSLSGAPILMCNLAKFLKKNGYFVTVMSPVDGKLSEKYKKYNIPIIIDESLSSTPLEEIRNFMENFDLLVANTILMWPSVLAANERHLAAIWMIHESQAGKEIALSEKGAQKAFQIADMLIFGCRNNQDLYRGLQHGTNFRTIHYGTEGLKISDDVSDQNFNEQKFTILHIGSIEPRKGQDVLIEAVKGMSKEYRDKIQVFLIGRKLNNPFFEKMQRLLKGSSNIEWLGELPHKEVATLMYRAQLFVCSSRDELYPLTVLEAMSAGKPVITTDMGGAREMITDGVDGFIVPNGDFQSLREKIEYCIKNPAVLQKMGGNARERFLKEFSLNKFGNRFLSILEEFVK